MAIILILILITKMNLIPMITMMTQASPWSSRTVNSRPDAAISDQHFIEVDRGLMMLESCHLLMMMTTETASTILKMMMVMMIVMIFCSRWLCTTG